MRIVLMCLLFIGILISPTIGLAAEDSIPAPEFSGVTAAGDTLHLTDFKGNVVLLDFWASWCKPCKEAMPFFVEFYEKHKANDFVLLSINVDSKSKNAEKFLEKLDPAPTFPMIFDPEAKIPPKYELQAMPTTFLIDKQGNIRDVRVGFQESEKAEYEASVKLLLEEEVNK